MKHVCMLISVADINAARKFYEDLFGLEVFQDYGRNIAFTCGLALQQDFDWLVDLPKDVMGELGSPEYPKEVNIRGYKPNTNVHIGQLKRAVKLLNHAKSHCFWQEAASISQEPTKRLQN